MPSPWCTSLLANLFQWCLAEKDSEFWEMMHTRHAAPPGYGLTYKYNELYGLHLDEFYLILCSRRQCFNHATSKLGFDRAWAAWVTQSPSAWIWCFCVCMRLKDGSVTSLVFHILRHNHEVASFRGVLKYHHGTRRGDAWCGVRCTNHCSTAHGYFWYKRVDYRISSTTRRCSTAITAFKRWGVIYVIWSHRK